MSGMRVHIIDSTLRDGEQAPGVSFTMEEKLAIARGLTSAGVPELECGIAAMGETEREEIRALAALNLPLRLTGWSRARRDDVDATSTTGLDSIHIAFPLSPVQLACIGKTETWVMRELENIVRYAQQRFRWVSVGAQDASRTPPESLRRFVRAAARLGVHRIRIADTVGIWNPLQTARETQQLCRIAGPAAVEFHGHNDLGMATANAIAAIQAGAAAVSVTVGGIGERAGNAALEQLAIALRVSLGLACGVREEKLIELCELVARASRRPIPAAQPVSGEAAFQHESGIHCHALIKDTRSFTPFVGSELGRTDAELVIGRHSGTESVLQVLHALGVSTSKQTARQMLPLIRQRSVSKKAALSPEEVLAVYHAVVRQGSVFGPHAATAS